MNYFEEFIKATQRLIQINSVEDAASDGAPFGEGVHSALVTTLDLAKSLGFSVTNGAGYYGYADIGDGSELFGILGHLDTVPVGNGWSIPPLSGTIIDDVLYGRGVLDDKSPILACMYCVAQLIDSGLKPNRRIRIVFGCDEESGWECMNAYTSNEEIPSIAFTPDGDFPVIFAEKGIFYYDISLPLPSSILSISGGARANMVMDRAKVEFNGAIPHSFTSCSGITDGNTVIFNGKSAHGSTPKKGDNAFLKLLLALSSVSGADYDVFRQLLGNFSALDGSGLSLNRSDEFTGATTLNIGCANTDEHHCLHFSLDIRTPISVRRDEVTAILIQQLPACAVTAGFYHDPLFVDPATPLVQQLLSAYREVTGDINAMPVGIGGGTYARAFPCAVAFGPIFPGQNGSIHEKDEHCSMANLELMYSVYLSAIRRICFR